MSQIKQKMGKLLYWFHSISRMVAAKMAIEHTIIKSFDKSQSFKNGKKPSVAQKRAYDVILLDLDMPILNGYDACA